VNYDGVWTNGEGNGYSPVQLRSEKQHFGERVEAARYSFVAFFASVAIVLTIITKQTPCEASLPTQLLLNVSAPGSSVAFLLDTPQGAPRVAVKCFSELLICRNLSGFAGAIDVLGWNRQRL
jgi:hypothetical protein